MMKFLQVNLITSVVLNISSFELVKCTKIVSFDDTKTVVCIFLLSSTLHAGLLQSLTNATSYTLHSLSCAWSLMLLGTILYFTYAWCCMHHFLEQGKDPLTQHSSIVVSYTTKFCFYLSSLADYIVILLSDL